MKYLFLFVLPILGQNNLPPAIANVNAPTYAEGQRVPLSVDLSGNLRTTGGGGGGGGGNVNLTGINGVTPGVGNPLRIDPTGTTTQPVSGTFWQSVQPVSQSGTWTIQPGNTANTTPWLFSISQGGNTATVSAAGALKTDSSSVTQPVSGTVTSNQGTAASASGAWTFKLTDGTDTANVTGASLDVNCTAGCGGAAAFSDNSAFTFGTTGVGIAGFVLDDVAPNAVTENSAAAPRMSANRVPYSQIRDAAGNERGANVNASNQLSVSVDNTPAVTQSGTWNLNNISGTVNLPTGAATAAKQPAIGTAGTASADVITVQGIASMTPLKTDGSAVTQPVSGTVTANAGTGNFTVVNSGTFATQAAQSGTWTVQPGNTANTTPWLTSIAQGGNTATVSAGGALKVDNSAVTQPVSGTVSASQSGTWTVQPGNTANTTAWLVTGTGGTFPATQSGNWTARVVGNGGASVDSTIGAGTAPTNQIVTGAVYNATEISPTNGQSFAVQADSKGRVREVLMDAAGNTRGLNIDAANSALVNPGTAANWGVGATGAAPPANAQYIGGISSGATGGLVIAQTLCDQWVAINGTASAQLISGVSGRKIYFCSGNIQMNGGANTVSFVSGTGSTCGTGTTAVPGFDGATSAANGYSFAANGGMVFPSGNSPFARTTNNADNFCILVGSATRVVGGLSYAIY